MAHPPNHPRKKVLPQDCWDLSHLFATTQEWESLYLNIESKIPEYDKFKNLLGESFGQFKACLDFDHALGRDLEKLYTYAHLKNDQDKTDADGDSLHQKAMNLHTRILDAASFIVPGIRAIPRDTLDGYMKQSEIREYTFYLEKIIRQFPHTRSEEAEQLLAMAGESLAAPGQIFSKLDNADLNFGTIKGDDGQPCPLTHGNFITYLSHKNRDTRKKAFHQYYQIYDAHKHSIASTLAASVKKDLFLARARHFDTTRQAALFKDDVSPDVYDTLITRVKKGLDPLYRYLEFRTKALGLTAESDGLHIYDTYVPVVPDVDFHMTYNEAVSICLEALAPLGSEYGSILADGLAKGWVDRYENKGKRSGAYSSGCYDSPPYILLNYDENSINSLFTLIHEAGHSMHSYFSNRAQPYPSHDYTIFVAEVASTLNETLLGQHLLKKYDDNPKMKAYILNREIDNIRGTFYRQTMFAQFEDMIHAMAAQNQPLTLETFTSTYSGLLTTYFGDRMIIDETLSLECLRIPHFYSSFYVYKYATGLAAALGICRRIQAQGQTAVDAYLDFLKLGGSMFPIEELKRAGVDMASSSPIDATISHFDARVAQLESVWSN